MYKNSNLSIGQMEISNNYVNTIYEVILEQLSNDLEQKYKLNWKIKSYDIFLGNYILLMAHVLYDRWIGVRGIREKNKKQLQITIPEDFTGLIDLCVGSDGFNTQIYTILCSIQNRNKAPNIELPDRGFGWLGMDNYEFNRHKVLADTPYFLNNKFEVDEIRACNDKGCIFDFNNRAQYKKVYNLNQKFRKENLELKINNFEVACLALCKLYLPVSYLESLSSLAVLKKTFPPKAVYTTIGCYSNTPIKFLVAENYNKIPYWIHQHGGNYGMDKLMPLELYEKKVSTKFYTWGWIDDNKTCCLPTKPRIKKLNQDKQVLLKTALGYKYRQFLKPEACVYHENIDHTKSTITFLNAIRKDIQLEISHYNNITGINLEHLYDLNKRKYSDKSRPDGAYKIHVCNYIGTAWLESIASDIPTIVFADKKRYCFRENVKELINELYRLGIIHYTPESAAEHLNNVYDKIDKWWESDELKKLKRKIITRFANFSSNWPLFWQRTFLKNLK
jgi:hypothetical protein